MDISGYIAPELGILIPVLYLIGIGLKKSEVLDKRIPLCLAVAGVLLAALWILASDTPQTIGQVLLAVFTAAIQGILAAASAVYGNQIKKQLFK